MSEKDPDKPWLYPIGNRLDPHDRLVTPLKQVVPIEGKRNQLGNITSDILRFGLTVSFTGQLINNVTLDSIDFSNQVDNSQSITGQLMNNVTSESFSYTNV